MQIIQLQNNIAISYEIAKNKIKLKIKKIKQNFDRIWNWNTKIYNCVLILIWSLIVLIV